MSLLYIMLQVHHSGWEPLNCVLWIAMILLMVGKNKQLSCIVLLLMRGSAQGGLLAIETIPMLVRLKTDIP